MLIAAATLIVFSLIAALLGRLSGLGVTRLPPGTEVEVRALRFEDRDDGAVAVYAGGTGTLVASIEPGQDGFVRGVLRGFARARRLSGAAVDTPLLRWEAAHGGSALNFVGSVLSVERIVAAYAKALDTGRLEVYAPWSDSVTTRLGSAFPAILPRIIPLVNRIGERGRTRFLEQTRRQP